MRRSKTLKLTLILLIGVFILTNSLLLVSASGFSPSSLVYNLEPDQEECKTITITSDSETITVSDKWAEDIDVEWKVSLFEEDASYHYISIDYDDELGLDNRELEVCLSGSEIGEYHGVMLLREEQEGNSIVQMGVWLKVTISEAEEQEQLQELTISNDAGNSGGGGSSGGGSSAVVNNTQEEKTEDIEETEISEEETGETTGETAGITGAVIGGENRSIRIIAVVVVLLVASLLVHYRNKKLKSEGRI